MNATATLQHLAATTAPASVVTPDLWAPATPGIELTVVVPFYNPGASVGHTVRGITAALTEAGVGHEIIAVNDGSTDGSQHLLAGIPNVRLIDNRVNSGKGNALHQGFAVAQGSWIGFIDADGDIDPQHLVTYLRIARGGNHAAVYADKRHADSASGATRSRKLISVTYSTLVTSLFMLKVKDTQTGCKIISRDAMAMLLPHLREQRFAFDLEFFVAAKAAGLRDLRSAPVRLNARTSGSTVSTRAIVRTLRDTLTIHRRHLSGHYHRAAA